MTLLEMATKDMENVTDVRVVIIKIIFFFNFDLYL